MCCKVHSDDHEWSVLRNKHRDIQCRLEWHVHCCPEKQGGVSFLKCLGHNYPNHHRPHTNRGTINCSYEVAFENGVAHNDPNDFAVLITYRGWVGITNNGWVDFITQWWLIVACQWDPATHYGSVIIVACKSVNSANTTADSSTNCISIITIADSYRGNSISNSVTDSAAIIDANPIALSITDYGAITRISLTHHDELRPSHLIPPNQRSDSIPSPPGPPGSL